MIGSDRKETSSRPESDISKKNYGIQGYGVHWGNFASQGSQGSQQWFLYKNVTIARITDI